jgi:hypothetical protein
LYPGVDVSTKQGRAGHWAKRGKSTMHTHGKLLGDHGFYRKGLKGIYIFRDGRDVALSLWRSKMFIHPDDRGLSLPEYLRKPIDWLGSPARKDGHGWTVFEHWKRHLDSWAHKDGVYYLAFEFLVNYQEESIKLIAKNAGIELEKFVPVSGLVGLTPNEGRCMAWKDYFTEGDRRLFDSIVPKTHYGRLSELLQKQARLKS